MSKADLNLPQGQRDPKFTQLHIGAVAVHIYERYESAIVLTEPASSELNGYLRVECFPCRIFGYDCSHTATIPLWMPDGVDLDAVFLCPGKGSRNGLQELTEWLDVGIDDLDEVIIPLGALVETLRRDHAGQRHPDIAAITYRCPFHKGKYEGERAALHLKAGVYWCHRCRTLEDRRGHFGLARTLAERIGLTLDDASLTA